MNGRRTAILYLAGVFLAGTIAGGFAGYAWGRRSFFRPPEPQSAAARILNGMKRDLALTEEQVTKVRPFVEQAGAEAESIFSSTFERTRGVMTNMNARIQEFLTPEQRVRQEKCDREREARFHKGHVPGPPGPPGPPGKPQKP